MINEMANSKINKNEFYEYIESITTIYLPKFIIQSLKEKLSICA